MNVAPMGVYTAQILTVLLAVALWLLGMAWLVLATAQSAGFPLPVAFVLAPLFVGSTRSIAQALRSNRLSRPTAPPRAPPLLILRPRRATPAAARPDPV